MTSPNRALYAENMLKFGKIHGDQLLLPDAQMSYDAKLVACYYDAVQVYQNIMRLTGDTATWQKYVDAALVVYRDKYVIGNNGGVPGYENFSTGLSIHYQRTGDPISRNAVQLLSTRASYTPDTTPIAWTAPVSHSREVAYGAQSYMDAEALGFPRRSRLPVLIEQALGHLDQWFGPTPTADFVRPFMVGLTSHTLIRYMAYLPDSRIPEKLLHTAEMMWDQLWVPSARAFKYTDHVVVGADAGGDQPSPDLNMIVAVLYGWCYRMTGDTEWRERAIQIFNGGVDGAWLVGTGKQFNQNYRYGDWVLDLIG